MVLEQLQQKLLRMCDRRSGELDSRVLYRAQDGKDWRTYSAVKLVDDGEEELDVLLWADGSLRTHD
jgi:hypothetical protein